MLETRGVEGETPTHNYIQYKQVLYNYFSSFVALSCFTKGLSSMHMLYKTPLLSSNGFILIFFSYIFPFFPNKKLLVLLNKMFCVLNCTTYLIFKFSPAQVSFFFCLLLLNLKEINF
jgi:hypothetical protein